MNNWLSINIYCLWWNIILSQYYPIIIRNMAISQYCWDPNIYIVYYIIYITYYISYIKYYILYIIYYILHIIYYILYITYYIL